VGSLSTVIVMTAAQRKGLLRPTAKPEVLRAGRVRAVGIMIVVAASMGVAWYSPTAAKYMWFLIAIVPRVMNRFVEQRMPLNQGAAPATGTVSPAD
jgi:hypothetical protein